MCEPATPLCLTSRLSNRIAQDSPGDPAPQCQVTGDLLLRHRHWFYHSLRSEAGERISRSGTDSEIGVMWGKRAGCPPENVGSGIDQSARQVVGRADA
jgi:hypothetical protein